MHRYWMLVVLYEDDFRRLDGVRVAEAELEAVGLASVEWVVVEHADVQEPLLKIVGRDEGDAGWEMLVEFGQLLRGHVRSGENAERQHFILSGAAW